MGDDISNMRERRRLREATQATADRPDTRLHGTIKVRAANGHVHLHIVDDQVDLAWSLSPAHARVLATTLVANAAAVEAEARPRVPGFRLYRRRAGYAVWLCQASGDINLPVPPLRRLEEARSWARAYAAQHGWAYREEKHD